MTRTAIRHHRGTVTGHGHHFLTAGRTEDEASTLVLLHGFPQTSR
jgi:hypothetical protein